MPISSGGLDLAGLIQAAQLGRSLNPEVMQQQALGNQLAQQLQLLQIKRAQQELDPNFQLSRDLYAALGNPLSGIEQTTGGLADVIAPTVNPTDLLDASVTPQSVSATRVYPRLGETGEPLGFQFNPALQEQGLVDKATLDSKINNILEANKMKSYAPGTLVANQKQLEDRTGFTVPEKAQRKEPLKFEKIGNIVTSFDPFTGAKVGETVLPEGYDSVETKNGLFIGKPSDPSSYKLVPGTGPSTEGTANDQYQADLNDRSLKAIESLKARTNENTVGQASRLQGASYYPKVLQTDEFVNYKADLGSLKSQFFLSQVAEMKANSKTGATGLGPVSDKEGKRLEDAMASMDQDQSPTNMKKNLDIAADAIRKYDTAKKKFGSAGPRSIPTPNAPPSGKIIVTAPNGVQGYWDASKPLPAGYTK